MPTRFNKIHPALKHAGYSATTLLPGEDAAEFDKLHRGLIAEYAPDGASEEDVVAEMAHYMWRKRNIGTFKIAQLAEARRQAIYQQHLPIPYLMSLSDDDMDPAEREERRRSADQQARDELGDLHTLLDIGEPATIGGLMKELDIKERLDGAIEKCVKRLLMIRGVKSLSLTSSSKSTPQISEPRKAG
jgi:hypothetical protein